MRARLQYLTPAQRSCDQVEHFQNFQTQYIIILLVQIKIMTSLSDHTQGMQSQDASHLT